MFGVLRGKRVCFFSKTKLKTRNIYKYYYWQTFYSCYLLVVYSVASALAVKTIIAVYRLAERIILLYILLYYIGLRRVCFTIMCVYYLDVRPRTGEMVFAVSKYHCVCVLFPRLSAKREDRWYTAQTYTNRWPLAPRL